MKMLCLGDSLTDCNRLFSEDPLGDGYVSILNRHLQNISGDFHFINRGIDGFTVSRLLDHARSQYLSFRADQITILIGINDIALMMNTNRTESQKEAMMNQFFQKYEELIRILRSSKLLLMEPFIFPWPEEYQSWIPYVQEMSLGIQALAEKYQISFLPLQMVLSEAAYKNGFPSLTSDGVHLTQEGHSILARQIESWLFASHN